MSKIKLTKKYSLLIPRYVECQELVQILESVLDKKVSFGMGLKDFYKLSVRDKDGKIDTFLDVDIRTRNGVSITTITQSIEGKETYGKEVYEKEPTIISAICNELEGFVLAEYYKTVSYCNLEKTCYAINYEKDSVDYKLVESLVNTIKDPLEMLAFTQILKSKRGQLAEILA